MSAADGDRALMYGLIFERYGDSALWGDGLTPVTVIVETPDVDLSFAQSQIRAVKTILKVRAAEVTQPQKTDVVTVGSVSYRVSAEPEADARRQIWTCQAVQVA